MDVICEHCRTEYEFDETLLSDRGTTVKCTTCGHTFRLFPSRPSAVIRVRRQDGTLLSFATLADVRDLAERRGLSEDDELSDNGGPWVALAEVPEIATILSRGHTRRARRVTPQGYAPAPQKATLLGVGNLPSKPGAPRPAPVPPPAARPVTPEPAPRPAPVAPEPTRVSVPAPAIRASNPTMSGYDAPATPAQAPKPQPPAPQPASPGTTQRPSFTPPVLAIPGEGPRRPKEKPNLYLDDDEVRPDKKKGRGPLGTVMLVLVAAGLGAGGFYAYTELTKSQTRAPLAASAMLVAEGESEAAPDTADAYRVASGTLDRVHQRYPDHWSPLAALARVHALWAQLLLFEAKDAAASPIPAEVQRAGTLRELARQHAEEALRYSARARALAPTEVHVLVAAADAARLSDHLTEARTLLEEAMRGRTGMSGYPHYVKALMTLGPALDDSAAGAALADAERTVALEPDRPAYRLLLARIELARGERARARAAVDLVLADDADHPAATALKRMLDAADAAVTVDAGTPVPTPAPSPAPETQQAPRRRTDNDNSTPADLP